jgi:hypothetical protein
VGQRRASDKVGGYGSRWWRRTAVGRFCDQPDACGRPGRRCARCVLIVGVAVWAARGGCDHDSTAARPVRFGGDSQPFINNPKLATLHSTDGINWSRDDVKPLAGFDSYGGGRIQVTNGNVLVTVVKPSFNQDGTSTEPGAIPKSVVLVGTQKA